MIVVLEDEMAWEAEAAIWESHRKNKSDWPSQPFFCPMITIERDGKETDFIVHHMRCDYNFPNKGFSIELEGEFYYGNPPVA